MMSLLFDNFFLLFISSRGHATLHLALSVGLSVGMSEIFLNCERFLVACYATLHPAMSVRRSPFYFFWRF